MSGAAALSILPTVLSGTGVDIHRYIFSDWFAATVSAGAVTPQFLETELNFCLSEPSLYQVLNGILELASGSSLLD